ncbi:MAG: hypothetical protein EOM91_01375 [Sphingobacteriia bacterium]|nr:hypothetical protein [Sphingobacteriia bacterium]NCC40280.1 hypothetical protein [Gammaproteobacteria bacterium]
MTRTSNAVHTGRLLLTPSDPWHCPDRAPLIAALAAGGFIGDPLSGPEAAFRVGPAFLELLAFTGCAVSIATEPSPGAPFCHVRIPPAARVPCLHHGRNTRAPRCGACRGRLSDWRAWIGEGVLDPTAILRCPSCGARQPLTQWDWKQQGGFARRLIQIEEIFPGEAVPTPALLALLTATHDCEWRYFYLQD